MTRPPHAAAPLESLRVRTSLGPYSVSWNASDRVQIGRLFRDGAPCSGSNGSFPGLASSAAQRYEIYAFTSAAAAADLITVAQTGASDANCFFSAWRWFKPEDMVGNAINYLADAGFTYPPGMMFPQAFSFVVPARTTFFVVANSIDGLESRGGSYTFTLSGSDVVLGCVPVVAGRIEGGATDVRAALP